MIGLITSLFGLADTTLRYIGEKERLKFRNKLYDLKKRILDEKLKPLADRDDAAMEKMYQELPLILEGIKLELDLSKPDK